MKGTAGCKPVNIPTPGLVHMPMSMHAGKPAKAVVAVGDEVKVGQIIGQPDGFVSSTIHSSVSGTVKNIIEIDSYTGKKAVTVIIETDGKQTPCEGLQPPVFDDYTGFLKAVRDSGVVGLGGAGFPTDVKLTLKDKSALEYILINGAECEPYITSDTRTMLDETEDMWSGILQLQKYMEPKNIFICIEENKPEAIDKFNALCAGAAGIEVRVLKSLYPQGERKVMVYNVTGRTVPEGARLTDVGCLVTNCTTVAVIGRYIKTGMPLVSRCITVDGSAVNNPMNVIAPVGTLISDIFNFCGGLKEGVGKILLGGPMMGMAVPGLDIPVVKVTSAVLAFLEKDVKKLAETACIKCSRCVNSCPMRLSPSNIEDAFMLNKPELLEKYKVNMCVECGCCAFSCPAKRPLVQIMQLSNNMLWEHKNKVKN